jgi:hypothetical protein
VEFLRGRHRMIVPDLRGYGKTREVRQTSNVATYLPRSILRIQCERRLPASTRLPSSRRRKRTEPKRWIFCNCFALRN